LLKFISKNEEREKGWYKEKKAEGKEKLRE
jgi:hypothetical protein